MVPTSKVAAPPKIGSSEPTGSANPGLRTGKSGDSNYNSGGEIMY
jgi:hypothetical protein